VLTRSELKAIRGRIVGDKKRSSRSKLYREDRERLYQDVIELSSRLQLMVEDHIPTRIVEITHQDFESLRLEV
jgi:hypothetical protein